MTLAATSRGGAGTATGTTTVTCSPTSTLPAGTRGVLILSYDNSGTNGADPFSSIATDSAGNVWTSETNALADPGAASAGATIRVFTSPLAFDLTSSGTVVITFSASTAAKAYCFYSVASSFGSTPAVRASSGNKGITGAVTNGLPTVTTGTISPGECLIGAVCGEGADSWTADGDATSGTFGNFQHFATGSGATGMSVAAETKIATAFATQTYNPTSTTTDANVVWLTIYELPVSGAYAWYDASNFPTITDAGGGAVSALADLSGNARNLSQATAGSRPTTGARQINALNAIDFDGTNDQLSSAALTQAQPFTIFLVYLHDVTDLATGVENIAVGLGTSGPEWKRSDIGGVEKHGIWAGTDLLTNGGNDANAHMASAIFNGASSQWWRDGTSIATGNPGTGGLSADTISLGAYPTGGGINWDGLIAEVIIFTSSLTTAQRQAVETYLNVKWLSGTALPVAKQLTFTHTFPFASGTAVATPAAKQLTFTHNTPTLTISSAATPAAKQLTFTHNTPALTVSSTASPAAKQLTFSFNAPTATGAAVASPAAKQIPFTHNTPTVTTTGDGTATPSAKQLTFTHNVPTVVVPATATPSAKQLTFTHNAPAVTVSNTATPSAKSVPFTFNTPLVTGAGVALPAAKQLTFTFNTSVAFGTPPPPDVVPSRVDEVVFCCPQGRSEVAFSCGERREANPWWEAGSRF